jgi:hypothetical protein
MGARWRPGLTALAIATGAAIVLWFAGTTHTVVLDEARLQREIDARLPIEAGGFTFAPVALSIRDSRVVIATTVSAGRAGQSVSFEARASGAPRYDPWAGALYLDLDALHVGNLTPRTTPSGERLLQRLAPSAVTSEAVLGTAERALRAALERVPVYRLRGDLGEFVLGSALESVAVTEAGIVLRLSLWQLTLGVLWGLFGLLVALAWTAWWIVGFGASFPRRRG